jgi:hypothetical protein
MGDKEAEEKLYRKKYIKNLVSKRTVEMSYLKRMHDNHLEKNVFWLNVALIDPLKVVEDTIDQAIIEKRCFQITYSDLTIL